MDERAELVQFDPLFLARETQLHVPGPAQHDAVEARKLLAISLEGSVG